MDTDCIFCKIVAGKLPCAKVYEDSDVLAFLDIGPVMKGHTLVIPKQHHDLISAIPADALQKVIVAVQKVARACYEGLGVDGMNVTQANGKVAGQIVPHIHFHIVPRSEKDGSVRNWVPGKYENSDELNRYAERIRKAIR